MDIKWTFVFRIDFCSINDNDVVQMFKLKGGRRCTGTHVIAPRGYGSDSIDHDMRHGHDFHSVFILP
jgi:hypothetical protein